LEAGPKSNFRYRLLHSIINGVLDADKLDYLRRDSTHLGVNFGLAIDHERLTRYLTVVYGTATAAEGDAHGAEEGGLAEIGVSEKALVVARTLVSTRRDMFTQVYWQHSTRALKAMLGFVVRDVLLRAEAEDQGNAFWSCFREFVFDP
jgi:HD superfamily phosphohydrolase